jgi:hypothetical protein
MSKKQRSDRHTTLVLNNASLISCIGDFLSLRDETRLGVGCRVWNGIVFGPNRRRLRMKREFHSSLMEPSPEIAHTLTTHGPAMWLDPKKPLPRVLCMPLAVASAVVAYITKHQARPTCLFVHDPALCTAFFGHNDSVQNAAFGQRPFLYALLSHVQSPALRNTALAFWCASDRTIDEDYDYFGGHPLGSDESQAHHPWIVLEADGTSDQAQFDEEDTDVADEYDVKLTKMLREYDSRIPGDKVEAFLHANNTQLIGLDGESRWNGQVEERDDAMVALGGWCHHLKATLLDIFPQHRPVLPVLDVEISMHVVPGSKDGVPIIPRGTMEDQAMEETVIFQWHAAIGSGVLDTEDKRREFIKQFHNGDKNDNIWKIMMAHYGTLPDPAHAFGIPECLV